MLSNDNSMTATKSSIASMSNSMHKHNSSDIVMRTGGKKLSMNLSINSYLVNSTKSKPFLALGNLAKPLSLLPTPKDSKCVSLLTTPKDNKESLKSKEQPKTVKATCKKFDIKSSSSSKTNIQSLRYRWEEVKTPTTPTEVLKRFAEVLPKWEQEEILAYSDIYYIGKNFKPKEPEFDDENGDYRVLIKDHIAFRYEIISMIGKGSFGQVLEVYDHKEKKSIALKIIKNKAKFNQQAKIEIDILYAIKAFDQEKNSNIIEILEFFVFRKHIVTPI